MRKVVARGSQVDAAGSYFQGYVLTTYDNLVTRFGPPDFVGGDKTNVEWRLEFEDGTIATIYDWKEPKIPEGEYEWHIGGFHQSAQDAIFGTLVYSNLIRL